jgi:PhzF family phenazine biosynthesis protein
MTTPIYQADAFISDRPFSGNPAGVCFPAAPSEETWMQGVAMEMNCAETAFLLPGDEAWSLRWFTPAAEVALCGHATLASAHILWESGRLPADEEARFNTKSGLLTCIRLPDGRIEMNFPAKLEQETAPPAELLKALGVSPVYTGLNAFDFLIEVASEEEVRSLRPDFQTLRKLPVRGVIVTSRSSSPGYDFVSRFFAPGVGVDEDPVTGSAHCALGPYWARRLGKSSFHAYQASPRGGVLDVHVRLDRVFLSGRANTTLRGEFC